MTRLGDGSAWYTLAMRAFSVTILIVLACGKHDAADNKAAPAGGSAAGTPSAAPTAPKEPAAAVKALDACSLLTKAEVEAIVKHKVRDPEPSKANVLAETFCEYGDAELPLSNGKSVGYSLRVDVTTMANADQAKQIYQSGLKAMKEEVVPGIGDGAYWEGDMLRHLVFVKGVYHVQLDLGTTSGGVPVAKALAEKAVAELP